jgi:hypothetical protein
MGWNDHVEVCERKCLACGDIREWWMWDDVGIARYSGGLGEMLGVDPSRGGKCPSCGSTRGVDYDEDSDDYWDALAEAEELTDEEAEAIEEHEDPRGFHDET